jgi:hypothetical protein
MSRYGGVGEDWVRNQYNYYLYNWDSVLIFIVLYIQGMRNAFVIHIKFCLTKKVPVPLRSLSFHCFPDLSGVHQTYGVEAMAVPSIDLLMARNVACYLSIQ